MSRDVAKEERLRVALVCAPEVLRLGLERLLAGGAGFDVRAHARLDEVQGPADVAILCERDLGSAAAACAYVARLDACAVLVMARHDPHVVLDCLVAGATGFLMEADASSDLHAATMAAAADRYHLGPRALTLLLDWQRVERRRAEGTEDAELRLLALLASGRTTQEIAAALDVSPKTVRNRSSLLYRRLGVRSRAQAVRVAELRGLLGG